MSLPQQHGVGAKMELNGLPAYMKVRYMWKMHDMGFGDFGSGSAISIITPGDLS